MIKEEVKEMKLFVIHTDSDFGVIYEQQGLVQHDEKVHIVCDSIAEFASLVLSEKITSNNEKGEYVLREMVLWGEGCYGNYSLSIEEYIPFIHFITKGN